MKLLIQNIIRVKVTSGILSIPPSRQRRPNKYYLKQLKLQIQHLKAYKVWPMLIFFIKKIHEFLYPDARDVTNVTNAIDGTINKLNTTVATMKSSPKQII